MIQILSVVFLLAASSVARAGEPEDLGACRPRIRSMMCLTNPLPANSKEGPFSRSCLAGGEFYAPVFEGHFDRAPELIQRMYCHMSRIFIENDFIGTAFAGVARDEAGTVTQVGVGIRREALDFAIGMDRWLSWKEETSYGGSTKSSDPTLGLIHYGSLDSSHEMFLDYVIAHEFGHLFDFANALNEFDDCREEQTPDGDWSNVGSCTPAKGSFAELSWASIDRASGANEYPMRAVQCSYFCNGRFIPRDQSAAMFEQLMKTSFVSPYASRYAGEDWAETFAVAVMSQSRGWRWGVETQGVFFDLSAHFESDMLAAKRDYVRRFLTGEFSYPGEGLKKSSQGARRSPRALRIIDVQSL